MELVEEVGLSDEGVDVGLNELSRKPRIGENPVEVFHHVVLGHRRDACQVGLGRGCRVDGGEAPGVPG